MIPAISILLPVRDAAATLGAALDSLAAQTCRDFEIVAVDDGSTDGSRALLEDRARRDPRLRVLARPPRGLVAALNDGLAVARAGLVARMDADDHCHPERLARQRAYLEDHAGLGVAGCRVRYGGDPVRQRGYAEYVRWTNTLMTHEAIALNRFVESPLPHPSVMFRRALVERHGGYREGMFPEDYELWLRWLDNGVRMAKTPEELFTWHDPAGRLSRSDPRYSPGAFYRLKAAYLARWLARNNPRHPEVTVWGGGGPTRRRTEHLVEHGVRIAAYIDIHPGRIGRVIRGRPVHAPDNPPPGAFIVVYVGNRGARTLIRQHLEKSGRHEGRDFIVAA